MNRIYALLTLAAATVAVVAIFWTLLRLPFSRTVGSGRENPAAISKAHASSAPLPLSEASASEETPIESKNESEEASGVDASTANDIDGPQQKWMIEMRELARQLSSDPSLLTEAVARLETMSDPEELALLTQAIAESAATGSSRFPVADLLAMTSSNGAGSRREAALHILSRLSQITPAVMGVVGGIATRDPAAEMRISAINTMGGWMARQRGLTEEISLELSRVMAAERSDQVRSFAIQAIANQDAPLSGDVLQTMLGTLRNEPTPHNRALAALALGGGDSPATRSLILQELKAAYLRETDLDTQRNLVTQIARAGKADALLLLSELPTRHTYVAQDASDYVDLLQTMGSSDFDAVWEAKSSRDAQRGSMVGTER